MWTEITKDLVLKDAIDAFGYDYEETEFFFYVMEYLRYVRYFHPNPTCVLETNRNYRRMSCSLWSSLTTCVKIEDDESERLNGRGSNCDERDNQGAAASDIMNTRLLLIRDDDDDLVRDANKLLQHECNSYDLCTFFFGSGDRLAYSERCIAGIVRLQASEIVHFSPTRRHSDWGLMAWSAFR